jgi:hypothetical protein
MTADKITETLRQRIAAMDIPANPLPGNWIVRIEGALMAASYARRIGANSLEGVLGGALGAVTAIEAARNEIFALVQFLARMQKGLDFTAAAAREALRAALSECGDPGAATAESAHHIAMLRLNGAKSAEITDEKALPDDCWRMKREPDKALINARLAKGDKIKGAVLVTAPPSLVITSKEK